MRHRELNRTILRFLLLACGLLGAACPRPPGGALATHPAHAPRLPSSLGALPVADCASRGAAQCSEAATRPALCLAVAAGPPALAACDRDASGCSEHMAQSCRHEDERRRAVAESRWERWTSHVLFRPGQGGALDAALDRDAAAISRNLHYLAISLEMVNLKNLVGFYPFAPVVLGVEVKGLLASGRVLRTVLPPTRTQGADAQVTLRLPVAFRPLLYTGQNVTLTVEVQGLPEGEYPDVAARVLAAQPLLQPFDPLRAETLAAGEQLFTSVLGPRREGMPSWRYSLTLYSADLAYRDKPDQLLLLGRAVVVMTPPSSAPAVLRERVNHQTLARYLVLRDERLVDRLTGEAFTEAPYLLVRFDRYERYPLPGLPLRQLAAQADASLEAGSLAPALKLVDELVVALNDDQVLSLHEKRLLRSFNELRRARVRERLAAAGNDRAERVARLREVAQLAAGLRQDFPTLLSAAEQESLTRLQQGARSALQSLP